MIIILQVYYNWFSFDLGLLLLAIDLQHLRIKLEYPDLTSNCNYDVVVSFAHDHEIHFPLIQIDSVYFKKLNFYVLEYAVNLWNL